MSLTRVLVVAVLVVAAVAGGTKLLGHHHGPLGPQAYTRALLDAFNDHPVTAGSATAATPGAFASVASNYRDLADALAAIEPPLDAQPYHQQLVQSARALAGAADHVAQASSPVEAQQAALETSTAGGQLNAAFEALRTRGYTQTSGAP